MTTKITKSDFIFLQDSLEKALISQAKNKFSKVQQRSMTVADACKGVLSYDENSRALLFTKKASDIANKVQFNLTPEAKAKILHIAETAKIALQKSIQILEKSNAEIISQNKEIQKHQTALNNSLKPRNVKITLNKEIFTNDYQEKIKVLEQRLKFYDAVSTNKSLFPTTPPAPSRTNSTNNLNQTTNLNGQRSSRKVENLTRKIKTPSKDTEESILSLKKDSSSSKASDQTASVNATSPNSITKTDQTITKIIDETPPRLGKVAQTKRCELTDEQGAFITVATVVAGLAIYIYSNYF